MGLNRVLVGFYSGSAWFLCEFHLGILCWVLFWVFVGFLFWGSDVVCVLRLFFGFIWFRFGVYVACSLCLCIVYVASMLFLDGFDLGSMCVLCLALFCFHSGFNLALLGI